MSEVAGFEPAWAGTSEDEIDSLTVLQSRKGGIDAEIALVIDRARRRRLAAAAAAPSRPSALGWSAEIIAMRELSSEVACALRVPGRSAERLIAESATLVSSLPATLESLKTGMTTYQHAQAIIEQVYSMPVADHAAFEEALVIPSQTLTVSKLRERARKRRERLHPESIKERHVEAISKRMVELSPGADGMSWLTACLPAAEAIGIFNRITDIATALPADNPAANPAEGPADGLADPAGGKGRGKRTLGQRRADVFIDLLTYGVAHLDDETSGPLGDGIRATVMVTVPVLSLLGKDDKPAELEGYGPIDIDTAKGLMGTATGFTRILTHPETGAVLSVGRKRYKVPKDLRLWLRVRDGTCRHPGCNRAAVRSDIDHTVAWADGGRTDFDNLAHLCAPDHHLKHQTGWRVEQRPGGVMAWTSPTGRTYTTYPETEIAS